MLDRRGLYQRLTGDSEIPQPAPTFFFGALPLDLAALDDNPSIFCRCRSCAFSKSWTSVPPSWGWKSAAVMSSRACHNAPMR